MNATRGWLARTNPVTRLGAALLATVPLFASLDWVSASVAIGVEVVLLVAGGIRPGVLARRCVPLLILAPLGSVSMLVYGKVGGDVWWHWAWMTISEQSAARALALAIRVFAFGIPFLAMWLDLDPTELADGLAQVLRLPARFVLGTLAALRLLTLFRSDWRSLALARRARGLGDTGALRRWATMSFALLVLALRRAAKLALAMEARGFGAGERTWARPSRVGRADAVCLAAAAVVPLAALAAAVAAGTFSPVFA